MLRAVLQMTGEVRFDVRGMPVPQGSARAFIAAGRAIVATEGNRPSSPLGAWRTSIATEARLTVRAAPLIAGPVSVELWFRLPRPKAHFLPRNSRRYRPVLRLDAPVWMGKAPDADKLARAALDALSSVVYGDDAQVARLAVTKRFCAELEPPGVAVRIRSLEETR